MLYVGSCPSCEAGLLGIRLCPNRHTVLLCDECDACWTTPQPIGPAYFPAQPALPCPHCRASLRDANSNWANWEEVQSAYWEVRVQP